MKPFVQTLISLLDEGKLSDFDLSFLYNWVGKYRADEQAQNLASNKLGGMYTTTAPLLALPSARQARRIRQKVFVIIFPVSTNGRSNLHPRDQCQSLFNMAWMIHESFA